MNTMIMITNAIVTEVPEFLQPLRALVTLLLSGVSIWGIVIIVKNVSAISTALKDSDDNGLSSGIKGLIGGLMLAGIGGVLTFLGITY